MSDMPLEQADREQLIDLIARRVGPLTGEKRMELLELAQLEELATELRWEADADSFSRQLVRKVRQKGTLPATRQPALVSLLRGLRRHKRVKGHHEEVAFLERLLAPFGLEQRGAGGAGPPAATAGGPTAPGHPAGATEPGPPAAVCTVLFMAANPREMTALRLGEEVRTIEERMSESRLSGSGPAGYFDLRQQHAVRWRNVSRHLLAHKPHVVHFAGHGERGGELVFENEAGDARPVTPENVAELFRILKDNIRCVLLNACWSEAQARAIVEHIDFVIGMTCPIPDDAAIRFAAGFYRGLAFRRDVQTAFDLGRSEMGEAPPAKGRGLFGLGRPKRDPALADIPQLLVRPGANPVGAVLVRR